jgi:hypothetical protein
MRIALSEQRLSRWATLAAAASFIVPVLGMVLVFGAVTTPGRDTRLVRSGAFWICVLAVVGYALSIHLLSSLPGRGRARRLGSWTFSVAFHGLMLFLGATFGGLGQAVAIFMAPEVLAVALSLIGFIVSLRTSPASERRLTGRLSGPA